MSMWLWSAAFLVIAIAAYVGSLKCVRGRAIKSMQFTSFIFAIFFTVSVLCMALSWKYACPVSDGWLTLECLKSAGLFQ